MRIIQSLKTLINIDSENQLRSELRKFFFRKKYNTEDLINMIKSLGITNGSNVFVHSSWDEFIYYTGSIDDFINGLLSIIGPKGTLIMPAYPLLLKQSSIFNVKTSPTSAGLIAETFRKYPSVRRSINLQHSVCALGPMSEFLTKDHHKSITSWDEKSPYYRLAEINAKILSFGLGRFFVGTVLHCAESILRNENEYFSLFFDKEITYSYKDYNGNIGVNTFLTKSEKVIRKWTNRSHRKVIRKYFDKRYYRRNRISNLTINCYDANYAINRIIELGRKGIVVYIDPDPKKYFN